MTTDKIKHFFGGVFVSDKVFSIDHKRISVNILLNPVVDIKQLLEACFRCIEISSVTIRWLSCAVEWLKWEFRMAEKENVLELLHNVDFKDICMLFWRNIVGVVFIDQVWRIREGQQFLNDLRVCFSCLFVKWLKVGMLESFMQASYIFSLL